MEQQPSVGRVVHYVDADSTHRAAIITMTSEYLPMTVDLVVFGLIGFTAAVNEPGVWYDSAGVRPRTWHWPERV